jgi:hypothetical protein
MMHLVEADETGIPRRSQHDPPTDSGCSAHGKTLVADLVKSADIRAGRTPLGGTPTFVTTACAPVLRANVPGRASAKVHGGLGYRGGWALQASPYVIDTMHGGVRQPSLNIRLPFATISSSASTAGVPAARPFAPSCAKTALESVNNNDADFGRSVRTRA